jgi:hypothetical protein
MSGSTGAALRITPSICPARSLTFRELPAIRRTWRSGAIRAQAQDTVRAYETPAGLELPGRTLFASGRHARWGKA